VTSWHGSRFSGDPDALGDAGADAVGVGVGVGVGDGDAGADDAGPPGGTGIGVADELDAGAAGAVVGGAIAVADTLGGSVVTLLLLDDLHELMSKAGVMTTRTSAARRCISGLSVSVVPCRRTSRLKRKI
jgi:hypothetical protein